MNAALSHPKKHRKEKTFFFFTLCLLISLNIFSQQKKDSSFTNRTSDYKLADSLFNSEDYLNAVNVYTRLLKKSSEDSACFLHFRRGRSYEGIDFYKHAIADLKIAVNVKENNPRYNEIKGYSLWSYSRILFKQGKKEAGLSYSIEAAKYIQVSNLFTNTGFEQIRMKQYSEALKNLNRAIQLDKNDAYAYSNRGLAYLKLNKLDSARADIKRSKELDSINPYAYKHAAMIWLELKNPDSACAELKKASDLGYYDFAETADRDDVDKLIDKHCTLAGKPKPDFSVAIRGKAIGFFIIEDTYFRTANIGAEVIYKDRHSFGVDVNYFRWRYERDDPSDDAMYEEYEKRIYLLADYKLRIVTLKGAQIYFNLYGKTGTYNNWYDHLNYPYPATMDTSFLRSTSKGTFKETGAGFGIKKYFPYSGYGFDLSANIAWRYSKNDELKYLSSDESVYAKNLKSQKPLFYMRLNFFYRFNK